MHDRNQYSALVGALTVSLLLALVGLAHAAQEARSALAGGELPTLRELRTVGCTDCDGDELLTAVGVSFTVGGQLTVLNQHAPFIRAFDQSSTLIWAQGDQGQAPAEMGMPGRLYNSSSGSLIVQDYMPPKFHRFSATGEFLGAAAYSPRGGVASTAYDRSGEQVVMVSLDASSTALAVIGHPIDGGDTHTFFSGAGRFPGVDDDGTATPGNFAVAVATDGSIVVGNRLNYRLARYDANGEQQGQVFGRDIARRAKTADEIEAETQRRRRRGPIDPEWPHFGRFALQYDGQGRLWVQTERGHGPETLFDLFTLSGELVGSVSVDGRALPGTRAFDIRDGELAVIVEDDMGGDLVRVWEILE